MFQLVTHRIIKAAALGGTIAFATAFATAGAQPPANTPGGLLVGEWKGETFAAGSVADITLNLFPNGTYARRIVSVTEYGWTLDGNSLLLAPVVAVDSQEATYGRVSIIQVTLAGDSLVATAGNEETINRADNAPLAIDFAKLPLAAFSKSVSNFACPLAHVLKRTCLGDRQQITCRPE